MSYSEDRFFALGHHHHHGHHDHHHHARTGPILYASLVATLAFTAVEVIAGFRSGSLALISDAGHNFTDALALLLAAVGAYLQSKPATETKTYGYGRAGVITAFLNACTLVVISGVIFWQAAVRLLHPQPVEEGIMIWVAAAALVLNGSIMLALLKGQKDDLNIRGAFIHMLGDAVGAVAIIAGAIAIHFTGWLAIDPILSIGLGGLIIYSAWDIVRESLNILLEGLPRGLELKKIVYAMSTVEGVLDVHDLHIWSVGSNTHALSSHVLIDDMPPSASGAILTRINEVLCGFGIHHTTIQFEHAKCAVSGTGCQVGSEHSHSH